MMAIKQYARHRKRLGLSGGTPHAVQVAIRTGRLSTSLTADGKRVRSARAADAEWSVSTHADRVPLTGPTAPAGATPAADAPPINELALARARHEAARASVAELELRRLQGELVPVAEVRAEVVQRYAIVRTKLLGVAARVKQRAPHVPAADVRLVDDLIREALEELADGAAPPAAAPSAEVRDPA